MVGTLRLRVSVESAGGFVGTRPLFALDAELGEPTQVRRSERLQCGRLQKRLKERCCLIELLERVESLSATERGIGLLRVVERTNDGGSGRSGECLLQEGIGVLEGLRVEGEETAEVGSFGKGFALREAGEVFIQGLGGTGGVATRNFAFGFQDERVRRDGGVAPGEGKAEGDFSAVVLLGLCKGVGSSVGGALGDGSRLPRLRGAKPRFARNVPPVLLLLDGAEAVARLRGLRFRSVGDQPRGNRSGLRQILRLNRGIQSVGREGD